MEAARLAVAEFTSRQGHTTEVFETVLPAVTRETVKPNRHEIITEAVDREVHQHHYHTTVQPLNHTETLPAVHTHNLIPIKHTHHEHDDVEKTKARVAADLAIFKHSRVVEPVVHTKAQLPAVIGEHYHHHVHEVVQPIIFKETIKPEIVHTTIPLHETHHHEPIHHGISELSPQSMGEFTKLGGILTGSKMATREQYEGAPRPYKRELATTAEKLGFHHHSPITTTTTTTTSTSTNIKKSHRPTPIDTTTPTKATTPGLVSPRSNTSSPRSSTSMPSTPTNAEFSNVNVRKSNELNNSAIADSKLPKHSTFLDRIRSRREPAAPSTY